MKENLTFWHSFQNHLSSDQLYEVWTFHALDESTKTKVDWSNSFQHTKIVRWQHHQLHLQTTFKQRGTTQISRKITMILFYFQNIIPLYLALSSHLPTSLFSPHAYHFILSPFLIFSLWTNSCTTIILNEREWEKEEGNTIFHMLLCVVLIHLFKLFYMILQGV
jgi:hypothetical protein